MSAQSMARSSFSVRSGSTCLADLDVAEHPPALFSSFRIQVHRGDHALEDIAYTINSVFHAAGKEIIEGGAGQDEGDLRIGAHASGRSAQRTVESRYRPNLHTAAFGARAPGGGLCLPSAHYLQQRLHRTPEDLAAAAGGKLLRGVVPVQMRHAASAVLIAIADAIIVI